MAMGVACRCPRDPCADRRRVDRVAAVRLFDALAPHLPPTVVQRVGVRAIACACHRHETTTGVAIADARCCGRLLAVVGETSVGWRCPHHDARPRLEAAVLTAVVAEAARFQRALRADHAHGPPHA